MRDYNFECSCVACLNDYSMDSAPRYDPNFLLPSDELPDTIEDSMTELKKHYKYIGKNFKKYPSKELFELNSRCAELLRSIEKKSAWPF